jgi:CheY-like chemotaxis protein
MCSAAPALHRPSRKRNILVIEDDPSQRELVRTILEQRGFEVSEACSGREGIECLSQQDFAVIVLDLRMPDGNGEVVVQWVLQHRIHLRTRILILTGEMPSPALDDFLDRLHVLMLPKPYLLAEFLQIVESLAAHVVS